MQVDRIDTNNVNIMLTNDEAGLLLNVLGVVSDVTSGEPLDRLFDTLMARAIDPKGTITIEANPMHDDFPEDEPSHNIVVED